MKKNPYLHFTETIQGFMLPLTTWLRILPIICTPVKDYTGVLLPFIETPPLFVYLGCKFTPKIQQSDRESIFLHHFCAKFQTIYRTTVFSREVLDHNGCHSVALSCPAIYCTLYLKPSGKCACLGRWHS